jgi:DNA-binding protein H-NS
MNEQAELEELEKRMKEDAKRYETLTASRRASVIEETKKNITRFGIKPKDLFSKKELGQEGKKAKTTTATGDRPPMYKHPQTGEVWAGKGAVAGWLRKAIENGGKQADYINPAYQALHQGWKPVALDIKPKATAPAKPTVGAKK